MKCKDVMTRDLECCLPTNTASEVAQLMKSRNIGPVPIVDNFQNNRLLGIVTDRDITLKVVAEGRDGKNVKVESIMTRDLEICYEGDDIQEVINLMEQSQVRRIPVVNKNNQIVGIITQADVATRLKDLDKTAEVVEQISKPTTAAGRR